MNFISASVIAFIGMPELLIILAIVVLLFGATKLPQLAKGLGESIKEFKKASKEDPEEDKAADKPAKSEKTGEHGKN